MSGSLGSLLIGCSIEYSRCKQISELVVYFVHRLCTVGAVDEKFQVSTRADSEGWVYLTAVGDRGTEYHVVMDCLGGVVTCTHGSLPVALDSLPSTLRVMLGLFFERAEVC